MKKSDHSRWQHRRTERPGGTTAATPTPTTTLSEKEEECGKMRRTTQKDHTIPSITRRGRRGEGGLGLGQRRRPVVEKETTTTHNTTNTENEKNTATTTTSRTKSTHRNGGRSRTNKTT